MSAQTQTFPTVRVPFLDLGPSHAAVREPILAEFAALIDEGSFTNGVQVREFEAQFARYCGTTHAVGVASGLDALRLALLAVGVGPGDEVIVPANTFIATLEAVTQAGARPVLADVGEEDLNLDVTAAERAISSRTRCILPVHLYGQMADMVATRALAASNGLLIIEDACQAHGAERDGIRAGSAGNAAAFSFYPGKNLGAFGDAGALTTESEELAASVTALREHGQRAKYQHAVEGYTARLDTMQAIVLKHKLPLLDGWNTERRLAAAFYIERLREVGDLQLPAVVTGSDPVWHLFVLKTREPEALRAHLASRGISTGRHYPQPTHLTPAYEWLGYKQGDFPVTEALAREALSLPLFPGITEAQLEATVAGIAAYFEYAD